LTLAEIGCLTCAQVYGLVPEIGRAAREAEAAATEQAAMNAAMDTRLKQWKAEHGDTPMPVW